MPAPTSNAHRLCSHQKRSRVALEKRREPAGRRFAARDLFHVKNPRGLREGRIPCVGPSTGCPCYSRGATPAIISPVIRLPFSVSRGPRGDLGAFFGTLELRVLEALWHRSDAASVRDLQAEFPATAYTTLMTTLDRLHRKGVLDRMKAGRAFLLPAALQPRGVASRACRECARRHSRAERLHAAPALVPH